MLEIKERQIIWDGGDEEFQKYFGFMKQLEFSKAIKRSVYLYSCDAWESMGKSRFTLPFTPATVRHWGISVEAGPFDTAQGSEYHAALFQLKITESGNVADFPKLGIEPIEWRKEGTIPICQTNETNNSIWSHSKLA
jgi:hypothetical protein